MTGNLMNLEKTNGNFTLGLEFLPEASTITTPKYLFEIFLRLLKDNLSIKKRKLLLRWVALKLGLITACLIEDGEDFENLNEEIREYMEKGVDKFYQLRQDGFIFSKRDSE